MSAPTAIPDLPEGYDKARLFYRHSNGFDVSDIAFTPGEVIADPVERALCRAFLERSLALLNAGPVRPGEEPTT